MKIVGVHEAKTKLSSLIRELEDGDEVLVTRGGLPVAKLVPVTERTPESTPGQRGYGMFEGQMRMADDFEDDEELFAEMFGLPPLPAPG